MKAVVQRVRDAQVTSGGTVSGRIERGLLVYLGVSRGDTKEEASRMAEKIVNLRIFADERGVMNKSLAETGGKALAVSQFTLLADTRGGRRPYYGEAADPQTAGRLYEFFMDEIRRLGIPCEAGVFQTKMDVSYTNDGPVTIILEITAKA